MSRPTRGSIDGGFGRGVPMTGRDDRPPTGYRRKERALDDDEVITIDEGDELFTLESDDAEPDDRRRDPLRRK